MDCNYVYTNLFVCMHVYMLFAYTSKLSRSWYQSLWPSTPKQTLANPWNSIDRATCKCWCTWLSDPNLTYVLSYAWPIKAVHLLMFYRDPWFITLPNKPVSITTQKKFTNQPSFKYLSQGFTSKIPFKKPMGFMMVFHGAQWFGVRSDHCGKVPLDLQPEDRFGVSSGNWKHRKMVV